MEKKFSFVKHLTKRDVEKILGEIGLELDAERYDREDNKLASLIRGTEEDGRGFIIVFCVDRKKQEDERQASKFLYEKSDTYRKFVNGLSALSMTSPSFGGLMDSYLSDGKVILKIDDFTITEGFSLKSEQEELDYDLMMTGIYQKYMVEKFGRFYNNMKAGYIRKLNIDEAKKGNKESNSEEEREFE